MSWKLKYLATGIIIIHETERKKFFKDFIYLMEEVVSKNYSLKHIEIFSSWPQVT